MQAVLVGLWNLENPGIPAPGCMGCAIGSDGGQVMVLKSCPFGLHSLPRDSLASKRDPCTLCTIFLGGALPVGNPITPLSTPGTFSLIYGPDVHPIPRYEYSNIFHLPFSFCSDSSRGM